MIVSFGNASGAPEAIETLQEAADAHRALENRETTGSTVLIP